MIIEAYLVTWAGVIAAQAAPGPNLAAVASIGLGQGRRPALWIVVGIASGMLIWSAATALGLAAVLEAVPLSLVVMRFAGGAYLLWLAAKALRSALRGDTVTIRADNALLSDRGAWLRGMFVVLTNPKAGLMWAAVATYLFGVGLSSWQVLVFGPLGAFSGLMVYGLYAWLFSTRAAIAAYGRAARGIEAVFAGVFGLLGGRLILDGLREIRG